MQRTSVRTDRRSVGLDLESSEGSVVRFGLDFALRGMSHRNGAGSESDPKETRYVVCACMCVCVCVRACV